MSRLNRLWRNLVHRKRIERDLDDELRSYVELTAEEQRAAGLPRDVARRRALAAFGGLDQVKERVRDVRAGARLEEFIRDVAYAIRVLKRHAGFTAVAAITLALGTGANTAVFSVVDTVVLRPPPYDHPDRLVKICGTGARDAECDDDFSRAELESIRLGAGALAQVAADDGTMLGVEHADGSRERVGVGFVTANWLATLGVRPVLGRDFAPDEEQPGRDRVVILTHEYWTRRFNGEFRAIGATLALDGAVHTVVGILPPNVLRTYSDVLKPLVTATYAERSLDVFARLTPDATPARASAEMDVVGRRLEQESPGTNAGRRLSVAPLGKYYAPVESSAVRGWVLVLGAVALVLFIACANVGYLLLARGSVRRRESLVRSALGASRARLVRQFLIENALLFVLGGALGLVLAALSLQSLTSLATSAGYLPGKMAVAIDMRVLGVSLLVSLLTGLAFGIVPALQASRVTMTAGLREAARTQTAGRRAGRRTLIVAQIALSLVLLAGFGLLVRSFQRVYTESGGFNPDNLLVTASEGGRAFPDAVAFWRRVMDQTRAIPGVASVAVTSRPPVHGARRQSYVIDGRPAAPADEAPQAGDILISADYFRAMGIAVLRGRAFSNADDERSTPVAIVSESVARREFPHQSPIGRRIRLLEREPMTCCSAPGPIAGVWREIVGVAADIRQANLDEAPAPTIYRPFSQIVEHDMFLVVRAESGAQTGRVAAELTARLTGRGNRDADSHEWEDVRSMAQVIHDSNSIRLRRFVLILLGGFAAMALLLAAVGIYGVAASAVAERTREIGVRIAFGATRVAILRQMLGEMFALASAGVIIGTAVTFASTRLIRSMLFGIDASDLLTYVAVAGVLGVVVLVATYIPSRRAMHVDPMVALRSE